MQNNQTLQTIKFRRATFQTSFNDTPVRREDLLTLLDAADSAPTHKRTQPWRFVVFRENGLQRLGAELSRIYKEVTPAEKYSAKTEENMGLKATGSQAAIAIVVNYSGALPEWEELAATACAVQNMWLAAHSIGLGGYWASPGLIKHIGPFLNLSPNQECIGFFYLGHHTSDEREAVRSPLEEKVRWEE